MCHTHYDRGSIYLPGNLEEKKDFPVVFWIQVFIYSLVYLPPTSILFYLFARGGYIVGNASEYSGNDLVHEAGGRSCSCHHPVLFGFLCGKKVKEGGALNAGLCKYPGSGNERRISLT
jgi:hypothetical protein